jgi:hypothetical protein
MITVAEFVAAGQALAEMSRPSPPRETPIATDLRPARADSPWAGLAAGAIRLVQTWTMIRGAAPELRARAAALHARAAALPPSRVTQAECRELAAITDTAPTADLAAVCDRIAEWLDRNTP